MFRHFFNNVVSAVFTFCLLVTLCFFLVRSVPGSPFEGESLRNVVARKRLETRFGLDRPLYQQFFVYVRGLSEGNLGEVYRFSGTIGGILRENASYVLIFGFICFVFSLFFGILLGWTSSVYKNRWPDYVMMTACHILVNVPSYIAIPITLAWLSGLFPRVIPTVGYQGAGYPLMFIPVIANSLHSIVFIGRQVRATLIEVMHQNYIRAARAKGLPESYLLINHLVKPTLAPLMTHLGVIFSDLLLGSLVVEAVFSLRGLGDKMRSASECRDYNVVTALVMFWAVIRLVVVILVECMTLYLNPKSRQVLRAQA